MRDNLERVTIVLTKSQHKRYKEHARQYHGSLSQFLRTTAEKELSGLYENHELNLRPIIHQLEKLVDLLLQVKLSISKIEREIDHLRNLSGKGSDSIAHNIETLLVRSSKPLSIPEISQFLPYTNDEIIGGIEKLEEMFAVEPVFQCNSPTKWGIKGGIHCCKKTAKTN